jgi:hypothetical protein
MRGGFAGIALFLFIMGAITAVTGDDASVSAIFIAAGWIVCAIGLADGRE